MSSNHSIILALRLASAVVSALSTFCNILLIFDMGVWNPQIYLILSMNLFQLPTDISYYLIILPEKSIGYIIGNAVGLWCALAASLIADAMIVAILCLVLLKNTRWFTSKWLLPWIHALVFIPCAIQEVLYVYGTATSQSATIEIAFSFYNYARLVSIAIGLGAYAFATIEVSRRFSGSTSEEKIIRTLITRLKNYPLWQSLTRCVFCAYYYTYGIDQNPSTETSVGQFSLQIIYAIVLAMASVSFFLIFLVLQPRAFRHLVHRLTTGRKPPPETKTKKFLTSEDQVTTQYNNEERSESDSSWGTFGDEFQSNPKSKRMNAHATINIDNKETIGVTSTVEYQDGDEDLTTMSELDEMVLLEKLLRKQNQQATLKHNIVSPLV